MFLCHIYVYILHIYPWNIGIYAHWGGYICFLNIFCNNIWTRHFIWLCFGICMQWCWIYMHFYYNGYVNYAWNVALIFVQWYMLNMCTVLLVTKCYATNFIPGMSNMFMLTYTCYKEKYSTMIHWEKKQHCPSNRKILWKHWGTYMKQKILTNSCKITK